MKAIILAGGLGTRLRERVPDLPKPMAPVAGQPFLAHLLSRLVAGGITEIIISAGYRAEAIIAYFGDEFMGARLSYSVELEPLGTGGAIAHALRNSDDEAVMVLNGDTLLSIDYQQLISWYKDHPAPVAMVLKAVPDVSRYGAVLTADGHVTGFTEKFTTGPGLINAGVYLIQPAIFDRFGLGGSFSFETELLQKNVASLNPPAFVTDGYFIDIGIPADYDRAQTELNELKDAQARGAELGQ